MCNENLTEMKCIKCATKFGIDPILNKNLLRSGRTFYCPNGHGQVYSKPIEKKVTELENKLNKKNRQLAKMSRELSNLKSGTCPKCFKKFVNLQKHITNKHPKYSKGVA